MTTTDTDLPALNYAPDHRPRRYVELDGTGAPIKVVYRASSLGACDRSFVACASGMAGEPHPDWFQEVLDEGTHAEAQINAWWEAATGIATIGAQTELELDLGIDAEVKHGRKKITVPIVVRVHPDGFATPASATEQVTVREYKKFRTSTYPNWQRQGVEVHKNYPWQIAACMFAVAAMSDDGKTMPLVEMVGAHWGVREDDPEGTPARVLDCTLHMIDMSPIPLRAIKQKINRIEGLIADGYTPQDEQVACDEKDYPCPYWRVHPSEMAGGKKTEKPTTVKLRVEIDDPINNTIIRLRAAQGRLAGLEAEKKKLEAARNELRAEIDAFLEDRGVDKKGGSADVNGEILERVYQERKAYEVKASVISYVKVKTVDEMAAGGGTKVKAPRAASKSKSSKSRTDNNQGDES